MSSTGLKILSANVRGFRTNIGELTHTALTLKTDIVVASETFLNDECVTTCDKIPGYCHWVRRDRSTGQGGGVAVCHREGLQLQLLSVQAPAELEALFFRLLLADKGAILLCAIYRPPRQGDAPLTFLTNQLDAIMTAHDCQNIVIVGDMNQHLVNRAFTELTVLHGLTNHVTFSTHVRGGSLDPVLTDLPCDSVHCQQGNRIGSSDHNAVLSHLGLNPASEEPSQRLIWLWDKAEWPALKRALADTEWDTKFNGNVNDDTAAFTATLLAAQTQFVPHREYRVEPRDQPWFGYRCRVAAEEKHKAWVRFKRRPNPRNKTLHRAACKNMTRTAAWARKRWERDIKRKLSTNSIDPKQWWSLVKKNQGTTIQERIPPLKSPAGDWVVKNTQKADLLATHFSQKMSTLDPERQPPRLPRLCPSTLDSPEVTENTVFHLLRTVNTKKAPGPDGVSPFLLKHCAEEIAAPLTHIFQQCLQTGTWPTQWKEARVTPVHKKRERTDPANYRPISLLSVVSKLLERVIAEQLTQHLEDHHLLSPRQFGFRKRRSASDLLLLLTKAWQDSLDSSRPSLVIALDIAGAFDAVWHNGLLAKLEQLGITGRLLALFSSYLQGRCLRVVVNGCTSATYPVEASVPQGSVLGPILWNVYLNDLLQSLPVVSAYADDCTLSHSFSRHEADNIVNATNRQLAGIMAWGRQWQVTFAADKTQAMLISRSREDIKLLERKLRFGTDTLEIKDSINILGVEVDSRLSFQHHLETVAHRASVRVTLLRRVRHLLDAGGLMRLYKAQVRPIMEYSPLTWMSSAQCHLSLLDKVQRRAEHLIQQVSEAQTRSHQQQHQRRQQQERQYRQQPIQQHQQWPHQQQRQQQDQPPPLLHQHHGQQQHQHNAPGPGCTLDSLEHRRRVGALTVLHKAQVQHIPHLAALRVQWRSSRHTTRTVVSTDLLLEIPRTHTACCQRAFTWATATLWNAFTRDVHVQGMSTQRVKTAAHSWCLAHTP